MNRSIVVGYDGCAYTGGGRGGLDREIPGGAAGLGGRSDMVENELKSLNLAVLCIRSPYVTDVGQTMAREKLRRVVGQGRGRVH